jgi:hypothetical protein
MNCSQLLRSICLTCMVNENGHIDEQSGLGVCCLLLIGPIEEGESKMKARRSDLRSRKSAGDPACPSSRQGGRAVELATTELGIKHTFFTERLAQPITRSR